MIKSKETQDTIDILEFCEKKVKDKIFIKDLNDCVIIGVGNDSFFVAHNVESLNGNSGGYKIPKGFSFAYELQRLFNFKFQEDKDRFYNIVETFYIKNLSTKKTNKLLTKRYEKETQKN